MIKAMVSKEDEKWQLEEDIRVLEKYSELLSNNERLKKAREEIKRRNKNINKVLDIK